MIVAVLDTNVLVSALRPSGPPPKPPRLIFTAALVGAFRCLLSDAILSEYQNVLSRPHLGIPPAEAEEALQRLRQIAHLVVPTQRLKVAADSTDDKFLECAMEGAANYVVPGNLRHFPREFRGVVTVSPTQFAIVLGSQL